MKGGMKGRQRARERENRKREEWQKLIDENKRTDRERVRMKK